MLHNKLKTLFILVVLCTTIWFALNWFFSFQHRSRASAALPTLYFEIENEKQASPGAKINLNIMINPNNTLFTSFDATFTFGENLTSSNELNLESNILPLVDGIILTKKEINTNSHTIHIQGIKQEGSSIGEVPIRLVRIVFVMKPNSKFPLEFKWKEGAKLDVSNLELKDLTYYGAGNVLLSSEQSKSQIQKVTFADNLHNKMIWVARIDGQFTEKEFSELATFDIVIIEATHGGDGTSTSRGNIQVWHDAARKLKQLNPKIKVFSYFNVSIIRPYMDQQYFDGGFKDEWYLRSTKGEKVIFNGKPLIHYVDLSNPQFRKWAIQWVSSWFDIAPYDGVAFDTAVPLSNKGTILDISENKANLWNQGMLDFFNEAKSKLKDKTFFVNGINYQSPDYNLKSFTMLKKDDIIFNERFCIAYEEKNPKLPGALLEDIDLTIRLMDMGLVVLNKTNYSNWEDPSKNYGNLPLSRFCYAASLMAYRQNHSYFKFGIGYFINKNGSELNQKIPEMEIQLGLPLSEKYNEIKPLILMRDFINGIVYINISGQDKTIELPYNLIKVNGNIMGEKYSVNTSIIIPARTALFFLKDIQ